MSTPSDTPSPYFNWVRPEHPAPILVEVPHAGLAIPDAVKHELNANPDEILRDSDLYVDRLCERTPSEGAYLLAAQASRYVVDLNRAEDDIDGRVVPDHPAPRGSQPRGVIWRMTTSGRLLMRGPLSFAHLDRRLELFHRPYHQKLKSTLAALKDEHGFAILIAAHSMPSTSRQSGRRVRRADVVPGSRGRTSADAQLIELVASHFRDAGLSVRHDEPYRGGYATQHYGRPAEGIHAIQLELNRALYVDESTSRPKEAPLLALQELMTQLIKKVRQLDLRR